MMKEQLVIIQANVPVCPKCNGLLKLNIVSNKFRCISCDSRYKVIDRGKNDRTFICTMNNSLHNM